MTRFLFIFVFVASLHVSAALHSQNKMVTLHLEGVSLEEVIQSLKLQTDYGFFYNIDSKDIKKMTNISVDVKNMALEDVLLQILKGTNLTYSIVNDVVILNTRNSIVVNDSVRKNHVLVGRVMDMNKEPLPGVTVRLENTSMGTATNFEGVFSFRLPVEKGKLILSFVGFKTKGVEFKLPSDTLKIVLEEEVENVEEVVVTGYFNKAKESFTQAKAGFDRQRETLENAEQEAVNALEHAFDFMEQAFENGEEMVVFVTELTLTPEAAMFLSEHTCERYMTYNEQLLIGKRKREILSELNR